jgi:hypothetical protein
MSGKNWNGERSTSVRPLNPAMAIQASGNMMVTLMRTMSRALAVGRSTRGVMGCPS